MNRRNLLAGIAAAAIAGPARAEAMTEAERRAQRTALFEGGPRQPRAAPPDMGGGRWAGEAPGTVVIETRGRRLHFVADGGEVLTWPIAVGREGAQWKGDTKVTHKRKNPEWRPTPNMRRRDPSLPAVVAPGPRNPMGIRAIYLAEGYLRIHGTNAPGSIGTAASSGCFRMHNEDVAHLFELVQPGALVRVLD